MQSVNAPIADAIKVWHRVRLGIDLDTHYPNGIVTVSMVGTMTRVAWKCDDATFKIGMPRDMWVGHESHSDNAAAAAHLDACVEMIRAFGLEPEVKR